MNNCQAALRIRGPRGYHTYFPKGPTSCRKKPEPTWRNDYCVDRSQRNGSIVKCALGTSARSPRMALRCWIIPTSQATPFRRFLLQAPGRAGSLNRFPPRRRQLRNKAQRFKWQCRAKRSSLGRRRNLRPRQLPVPVDDLETVGLLAPSFEAGGGSCGRARA